MQLKTNNYISNRYTIYANGNNILIMNDNNQYLNPTDNWGSEIYEFIYSHNIIFTNDFCLCLIVNKKKKLEFTNDFQKTFFVIVKEYLELSNSFYYFVDENYNNMLMNAIKNNSINDVQLYLSYGFSLDYLNKFNQTVFDLTDNKDILNLLTSYNKIDIPIRFYNSRHRQIELFKHSIDIPINMYTCGPTVYDRVHLGNLKTFIWSDFVVSFLQHCGYKINHIMNITDIDDKIISRLKEKTYDELIDYTSFYSEKFIEDMHKLGVQNYDNFNIYKVTDNVDQIENMILTLLEKGYAYRVPSGSIYFDSKHIENNQFFTLNDIEEYNP